MTHMSDAKWMRRPHTPPSSDDRWQKVKDFVLSDIRLFFLPITAVWKAVVKELKA